jgi:nucleoside permease NupC
MASLQGLSGLLLFPLLARLMGIPWSEAATAGSLLGMKSIVAGTLSTLLTGAVAKLIR